MSETKKRKVSPDGKPYEIDPDFTEGNITLVSDDEHGFRVYDYYLKAKSSVFRNMLALPSDANGDTILIPDCAQEVLRVFVSALSATYLGEISWKDAKPVVELCWKYDCPEACRAVLDASVTSLTKDDFWPAFEVASRLTDVTIACRILLLQRASVSGGPRTTSPMEIPTRWSDAQAMSLSKAWPWAAVKAERQASVDLSVLCQSQECWFRFVFAFGRLAKNV